LAESGDADSSEKSIETVVDRLYDIVKAKKSVPVREISKALSLSESQTEKLARLLESSKLVQVNYSLSDIIITIADQPATHSSAASVVPDAAERAILSACDDVARVKSLLEFSRRNVEQLSKKIAQEAPQQAAALKAKDVSPVMRKRLESLEADAAQAKAHANAILAASAVLQEASQRLSQVVARKGARQ
jgi:hypothetical protein